jgi:hypothetical protein
MQNWFPKENNMGQNKHKFQKLYNKNWNQLKIKKIFVL